MNTYEIKSGIRFHTMPTDKWKTTLIGLYFQLPMTTDLTKLSLISSMISRGIEGEFPTDELSRRLQELYGARAATEVRKRGDIALFCVLFDFIQPKYIGEEPLLEGILDLIRRLVFGQRFGKSYLEQEKANLESAIAAQMNDKRAYAANRLIEEMCEGEPFSLNELGKIEEIPSVTAEALQEYYETVLLNAPLDIFVTGDADFDRIREAMTEMTAPLQTVTAYPKTKIITAVTGKEITEEQPISQGKLNLGFRTKMEADDPQFAALTVFNAIFGGGVYSKLFNNVREKMSLCYYVYSSLNRQKGLMTVGSGIASDTVDRAKEAILQQLDDTLNGRITEKEFEGAVLGLANSYRSMGDSAALLQANALGCLLTGLPLQTPEEMAEEVQKVTPEEAVKAGQQIELDTVYFLKGVQQG